MSNGYMTVPLQPQFQTNPQSPAGNYGNSSIADLIMQDISDWGKNPSTGVLKGDGIGSMGSGNQNGSGFWNMDSAFGNAKTGTTGWAPTALSAGQGLFNAYLGMKQYGLMKDQLSENKRQFNLNYENQRSLTNSQLRDRQAARVASNPNAYQSVSQYMKENGV